MKRALLQRILSGSKDIRFDEMMQLAEAFGFRVSRIRGSHHILVHPHVRELVTCRVWVGRLNPIKYDSSCVWLSATT